MKDEENFDPSFLKSYKPENGNQGDASPQQNKKVLDSETSEDPDSDKERKSSYDSEKPVSKKKSSQ